MKTINAKKKGQEEVNASLYLQTDPLQVNIRLYQQVSELLTQLENAPTGLTIRERVAALVAIGRIQILFVGLRKEKLSDPTIAGSKVRKYSTTFQAHGARERKTIAGPAPAEPEPSELDGLFDDDADDAAE